MSTPENIKNQGLFNLSLEQVMICVEEKLDLNLLYLLDLFDREIDVAKYANNPKFDGWKQTLFRKSLIDSNGKVLNKGKLILDNIRKQISRKDEKLVKNVTDEETEFDIWWKTYPSTDIFEVNGKRFKGTRKFKVEKDTCRQLFARVLNTNDFTAEELIEAIKLETETRIEESYKKNENKLSYLQNTATYLRQYSFESYVELVRKGFKAVQSKQETKTDYQGGVYL